MVVIFQSFAFAMLLVVCVSAANRHVQAERSSAAEYRKDIPADGEHKLLDRGLDDGGRARGLDGGRARGLDDGRARGLDDGKVMMGYSDSWVVEVKGGKDEADRLADGYGFVNLGQVSDA